MNVWKKVRWPLAQRGVWGTLRAGKVARPVQIVCGDATEFELPTAN